MIFKHHLEPRRTFHFVLALSTLMRGLKATTNRNHIFAFHVLRPFHPGKRPYTAWLGVSAPYTCTRGSGVGMEFIS